jgi:hypothetical protein
VGRVAGKDQRKGAGPLAVGMAIVDARVVDPSPTVGVDLCQTDQTKTVRSGHRRRTAPYKSVAMIRYAQILCDHGIVTLFDAARLPA